MPSGVGAGITEWMRKNVEREYLLDLLEMQVYMRDIPRQVVCYTYGVETDHLNLRKRRKVEYLQIGYLLP